MAGVIGRPLAMLFDSAPAVGASTGQHKGGMDGYFGADAIAKELEPSDPFSVRVQASKMFLERIRDSLSTRQSMVIESTLAGRSLRRFVESANNAGYQTYVFFTFVDSADVCVDRVLQRTRRGGHDVPEPDIRRRFLRTINNFWHIYRPLADVWVLVYNGGQSPEHVAFGYGDTQIVRIFNPTLLIND